MTVTIFSITALEIIAPSFNEIRPIMQTLDFPFCQEMPCGHFAHWASWEDLPIHDVPCPCGDPTHWLLKIDYPITP